MVNTLKKWWQRLSPSFLGRWLFSKVLAFLIPYTGTISPRVLELRSGFAEVSMRCRHTVKNHLKSIHALALGNLGELTTGLALHFALNEGDRAILTKLEVEFLKKARGVIVARARLSEDLVLDGSITIKAELRDANQDIVAVVHATWLVRKPS